MDEKVIEYVERSGGYTADNFNVSELLFFSCIYCVI